MLRRFIVSATLLALLAPAAWAQRPVSLLLGGGATVPVGALADATGTGWNALAGVAVSTLMQPLGLRLDGAYHRLSGEASGPDRAITSGTLNVTYRLPTPNTPIAPYVIAGGGVYRLECRDGGSGCGSDTRGGWNAGLGTKIAALGLRWFVEARFHHVGDARYVPMTIGVGF